MIKKQQARQRHEFVLMDEIHLLSASDQLSIRVDTCRRYFHSLTSSKAPRARDLRLTCRACPAGVAYLIHVVNPEPPWSQISREPLVRQGNPTSEVFHTNPSGPICQRRTTKQQKQKSGAPQYPYQQEAQEVPTSATMAPTKKAKKTADSINSRLALVMKSGKGEKNPYPYGPHS